MPLEKIYFAPSGDGLSECPCAVHWAPVCGKFEQIFPPAGRPALSCVYREHLVALHGFIKKSRATLKDDLALARKRRKELMR